MHQQYLLQALSLAEQRLGFCAPNPAVGCVLVKDEKVVAAAAHQACGEPHAEAAALTIAGNKAKGATAYVTLEPCGHYGRTPPCTNALIDADISAVYYAMADPHRDAKGGAKQLQQAGIPCQQLVLPEVEAFYQPYLHWLKTSEAQLTAKIAVSLDGKYAYPDKRAYITGDALTQFTMERRLTHDVLVTSAQTVIADDPQFNVRLPNTIVRKPIVILDSQLNMPLSANILTTAKHVVVCHADTAPTHQIERLVEKNIQCISMPLIDQKIDILALPKVLGSLGFHTAWLEMGTNFLASFIESDLLYRLYWYIGNKFLGSQGINVQNMNNKWLKKAQKITWHTLGNEVYCDISLTNGV